MRALLTMKDYFTAIFEYEFETGSYGMETSEFTDEIIWNEVNRLTKHRKELDFVESQAYVFIPGALRSRLLGYASIEAAVHKANNTPEDSYILSNEGVYQVNDGVLTTIACKV